MFQTIFLAMHLAVADSAPPSLNVLDEQAIDRTVNPCDDFYHYACGNWLKKTQIPPDKSYYGRQETPLQDRVEEQLNSVLENLTKKENLSGTEKKLSDLYRSCRAVDKAENYGVAQIKSQLEKINQVTDRASLSKMLAELDLAGTTGFFSIYGEQDPKDSNHMIAIVDRGGMSLPDPDYYLKDDKKSKDTRAHFTQYIAKVWELAGFSEGKKMSETILQFETDLARHALKLDEVRDMAKRFHPMTLAQVKALVPLIDWDIYFKTLGIPTPKKFNVVEPEFLKNMNERLAAWSPAQMAAYLKYQTLVHLAYFATGPFAHEDFLFWHAFLLGQKEMPPRWKYCERLAAGSMSEALGKAYVDSVPDALVIRDKTNEMMDKIKSAFQTNLKKLTWMDESTRRGALRKLAKMRRKVGWPKKWRDYSKLHTVSDDLMTNALNANEFETRRNLAKIGKPTDRSEWELSVWDANAYYAPNNNEMVIPLGEAVPPIFDLHASDGANYGSFGGGTIGHELTHGFDDDGKDMDADGNYITWWSDRSKEKFASLSSCFERQTEDYPILPGEKLRIRGKATLGENLADNGGVKLGLQVITQMKKKPSDWKGFDDVQQYFLAYAQSWCIQITPQALRERMLADFHPPSEFRVNVVLANRPEFATAFKCPLKSRMNPEVRCSIW